MQSKTAKFASSRVRQTLRLMSSVSETREEALGHGVIEAVADDPHGRHDLCLPEPVARGQACVLAAVIAVMDGPRRRPAAFDRNVEGGEGVVAWVSSSANRTKRQRLQDRIA